MSGSSQNIDVVVAGGGPAGGICALTLAHGGARVSLVHWDGYSTGGIELVSGRARRMIERYCPGFFRQDIFGAGGVEVHETISLWGTPEPVTLSAMFNPWGPGVAVERTLFDQALRDLAEAAGVSVIGATKVADIERGNDQWQLSLRSGEAECDPVCARFLVLATGRAAAHFFDPPPLSESSQIALMAPLSPLSGVPDHALYIEAGDNGWWYALPTGDGGHFAGFCTSRDEIKRRRASLREFFLGELRCTRLLAPLLGGPDAKLNLRITGRMAGARAFSKAAGNDWIAVGDAAYAPDPLSGMGIELAIESAQLGARALLEAMRETGKETAKHDVFAEYEDAIRERASQHGKVAARHYGSL
ncbi:NAD(P)/FAD-dependent oxidoreductase [Nitrosospira sp. Nsp13]|uniref:NAD(P)/FAD-dependent oxidoreductase n=1 Tax=Nitrosospira sp. Nsp13 TaxID=1855332 RepID=UPI0008915587|nr:FAD-dependent oxidoreductase [Nitrosospira sp. Nsp13]SCX76517.1 Dehydrogenase (flavoprotein) [Nitrosospira sp. Nsp13]